MRKFILILSVLYTTTVFSVEPDEKLHKDCLYPTVLIASSSDSSGTGTIIRSEKINDKEYRNVILTCAHILGNEQTEYKVMRAEYKNWSEVSKLIAHSAVVYTRNDQLDLAIMCFISSAPMPVAKIDFDFTHYIGTDIFKIGCGGMENYRLDYGKISSARVPLGERYAYRTSAFTIPGDSGGPVFYDYKIIGVVHAIKSMPIPSERRTELLPLISFFISTKELLNMKGISFVLDQTKPLPQYDYAKLKLMQYELDIIPLEVN